MLWSDVTGQPTAASFLRKTLTAARLPNLMLFSGPRGVGKRTTARVFAAAALCESQESPGGHVDEACGTCRSCREFAAGVHADFVLPKVMAKEGKEPEFRELTDEDRMITLKKTVRPLLEDVRLRSARGGRRVALVRRAERMNEESQNTLLKSLEEPPGDFVWILTADDPSGLLDTVRSRATRVRFGRVPPEPMARSLAKAYSLDAGRARDVALASEGSFARASQAVTEAWQADCDFVESRIVPKVASGAVEGPRLARDLVQRARSAAGEEQEGLEVSRLEATRRSALRLVGVLQRSLRDRLRESVEVSPEGLGVWADGLEVALDSEAALRQNVRVELALTVAGLRLARART